MSRIPRPSRADDEFANVKIPAGKTTMRQRNRLNGCGVQRLLLFLVLSVYCVLVCHNILTVGRNGDGVEYAAVTRNMAPGWGTFWAPYLSETFFKVHHEHPPLVYWIQSLFFRLLGDTPYLEGIYGFCIGVLILSGTAACWQQIHRHVQARRVGSWWPLFLLISLPVTS